MSTADTTEAAPAAAKSRDFKTPMADSTERVVTQYICKPSLARDQERQCSVMGSTRAFIYPLVGLLRPKTELPPSDAPLTPIPDPLHSWYGHMTFAEIDHKPADPLRSIAGTLADIPELAHAPDCVDNSTGHAI